MKKVLAALLFFVSLFALSACSVTEHGFYDNDAEIAAHAFGSMSSLRSVRNSGFENFSFSADQWDGTQTLKTITVAENPVLDVSMQLAGGRMKLVALREDDAVFLVAEVTSAAPAIESPYQATLDAGQYRFLLVAEVAEESDFLFRYPVE